MSDVANLLLKISGDPADAKNALREVAAELKKFGAEEATAHIGIKGYDEAKLKLDSLEKSLTVIGKRDVTAKVKVDIEDAKAKIAKLRRELDLSASGGAGGLEKNQLFGDVDKLGRELESKLHTRFERITQDAKRIFRSLHNDLGATLGAGAKALPGLAASGAGLAIEGGGAAVKGIAGLGQAAVSAVGPMAAILALVLAFVPALIALTASLAGAIAGFSVIAVSFVGVLAPALVLVVGVIKELVQSWQAVTQRQEAAHASAVAVAQAQQGLHAATLNLSESQRSLKLTTEEAYTAWRASLMAVKEDLLSVESAQLGIQGSTLAYKNSLQALKEFRNSIGLGAGKFDDLFKKFTNVDFDPKNILKSIKDAGGGELGRKQNLELQGLILAIKQAKLGEAQAQESLHSSSARLQKDRRVEAKYLKEGIRAYPAYISALRQVRTAEEGLTTAQRSLATAQYNATKPINNLSKEQLKLGTELRSFVADLKKLFGPATKEIFKGLEAGLHSILGLVKGAGLSSAFKGLGRVIGEVFAGLGKMLSSPEMRKNLIELVKGSSQLVKTLGGPILLNFIRLFTNLALAAMPAMLKIVERIGAAFKRWAHDSSNIDALRKKIRHIIDEFEKWWKLIGALGRLISAFFRDTAKQGDGLAVTLTGVFEKWTKFLNTKAGQQQITNFFKESISFGKELIEVLKTIVGVAKTAISIIEPIVEAAQAVGGYLGEKTVGKEPYQSGTFQIQRKAQEVSNLASVEAQLKSGKGAKGPLTQAQRTNLENTKRNIEAELGSGIKRQAGGLIGATWGGGDRIRVLGEAGEFMLRKEVVNSVGRSALDRLNATGVMPVKHGGGGDTYIEKVVLPAVPGHPTMDPRVAAVKFARELSGRGVGSG